MLPGETTQLSRRRKVNRGVWMVAIVVGAAAATALAIVAVSALRGKGSEQAPAASAASSAPSNAPPPIVASAPALPSVSAPAVAAAQPTASATAGEPASAGSTSPLTKEIQIPAGWGVVQVHSPPAGVVYVHGTKVGETDAPALAPCGRRYVRVGTAGPGPGLKGVSWLSAGQSIEIPCGKMVEIPATPDHPITDKPGKKEDGKRPYNPKSAF